MSENTPLGKRLWITGTDTDVGKTVVTALVAAAFQGIGLKTQVAKPLQSGAVLLPGQSPTVASPDLQSVRAWLKTAVPTWCGVCLEAPATPWIADETQHGHPSIDLERITAQLIDFGAQGDVTVVEAAGGVYVPLTPTQTVLGWLTTIADPVIVVARPNLGTINHTLLTVNALLERNIPVLGVVVSGWDSDSTDIAQQTLPQVFERFLPVPVLAWVPRVALNPQCIRPDHGAVEALFPALASWVKGA